MYVMEHNNTYNLMNQMTQESKSLWRIKKNYLKEAKTKQMKAFWTKMAKDKELEESVTCKKSLQVQKEGNREVTRRVKEYNLDVMIAVGYRVGSVVGTRFRQWATKTLREHITKGYTIKDAASANTSGLEIVEGNAYRGTLDVIVEPRAYRNTVS